MSIHQKALSGRGLPPHWQRIVRRVLIRDNYKCAICGKAGANSADHVVPRSKGGTHDMFNLRAAHMVCNSRKGNHIVVMKPNPSRWE